MAKASSPPTTPLMRQYHSIKQQAPNALLMFRLGDFYELFYDDALVASRDLEITLTSRNKERGEPVPMCGVPFHAADNYIAKLIAKGHRVAICDQVEDAKKAKKLVRREITRVVTPGTANDLNVVSASENNYIAAAFERGDTAGLAYVDLSTGEFRMTEVTPAGVEAELENLGALEVVQPSAGPLFAEAPETTAQANGRLRTELEAWVFEQDHAERTLLDHFGLHSLDGLGAPDRSPAVSAAGAILHYLRDTQKGALEHLDRPRYYQQQEWMVLDPISVRNLELVEPQFGGSKESTLLSVLDETRTSMGARLLRRWLLRPAVRLEEIHARLDAVGELVSETIASSEIEGELKGLLDLERLLSKVTLGSANPRDVVGLGNSLARVPQLRSLLEARVSPRLRDLRQRMDELAEVRDKILGTLAGEPPVNLADGGVVREGIDPELDELRDIRKNSRAHIAAIETRERAATGIQSLKVRFNQVFGFYIEVSKANMALVPEHYDRKQTLVNAERFITPELKNYESKVLAAEERILEKEKAIFERVKRVISAEAQRTRVTATAIAELDVLRSLAQVSAERDYVRPEVAEKGPLQIAVGRHPVIERLGDLGAGERFVPNDIYLDDEQHLIRLVTGPNMGGKSTYLRQAALTVILAQIGSFVPARSAQLPVTDRIFTRIGASDNLAMGRSTFMVEMTETAEILNTATSRSLILLDEIGRGTSTFDGLSIAWAVVEYIHGKTKAKTLFATHYHELTELAELLPGVTNLHVSVKESGERVIFLRKVAPGKADRSYGIEVARLAGLPMEVVLRARSVLRKHEARELTVSEELSPGATPAQTPMFDPTEQELIAELENLDLDEVRPLEALNLLNEWKKRLTDREETE